MKEILYSSDTPEQLKSIQLDKPIKLSKIILDVSISNTENIKSEFVNYKVFYFDIMNEKHSTNFNILKKEIAIRHSEIENEFTSNFNVSSINILITAFDKTDLIKGEISILEMNDMQRTDFNKKIELKDRNKNEILASLNPNPSDKGIMGQILE